MEFLQKIAMPIANIFNLSVSNARDGCQASMTVSRLTLEDWRMKIVVQHNQCYWPPLAMKS
jgi:hypothetical protein